LFKKHFFFFLKKFFISFFFKFKKKGLIILKKKQRFFGKKIGVFVGFFYRFLGTFCRFSTLKTDQMFFDPKNAFL
jgi:hypothetical protein